MTSTTDTTRKRNVVAKKGEIISRHEPCLLLPLPSHADPSLESSSLSSSSWCQKLPSWNFKAPIHHDNDSLTSINCLLDKEFITLPEVTTFFRRLFHIEENKKAHSIILTRSSVASITTAGVEEYALLVTTIVFVRALLSSSSSSFLELTTKKENGERKDQTAINIYEKQTTNKRSNNNVQKEEKDHNDWEQKLLYNCYNEKSRDMNDDEVVEECWAILCAACLTHKTISKTNNNNSNHDKVLRRLLLDNPILFSTVYTYVKRKCLFQISVPQPLGLYMEQTLPTLSDEDVDLALVSLKPFVVHAFRNDGTGSISSMDGDCGCDGYGKNDDNDANNDPTKNNSSSSSKASQHSSVQTVVQRRKAARLSQMASFQIAGNGEAATAVTTEDKEKNSEKTSPFESLCTPYNAFCTGLLSTLEHSCIPNCAVIGKSFFQYSAECSSERVPKEDDEKIKVCIDEHNNSVHIELMALRDVYPGDKLTISRIGNLEEDVSARSEELKKVLGDGYKCDCPRCRYERVEDTSSTQIIDDDDDDDDDDDGLAKRNQKKTFDYESSSILNDINSNIHPEWPPRVTTKNLDIFTWSDLKSTADLAMQQGRYADAASLYSILINHRPNNGDVLHARAASYLGRNKFFQAQSLWEDAYLLCPEHDGIALQKKKSDAYGLLNAGEYKDGKEEGEEVNAPVEQNFTEEGNEVFPSLPEFFSYLNGVCFVTKPNQALLTSQECRQVINWAEEEAQTRPGKGWTTTRHYDVPTTDLPVHEISPLLPFFNNILKLRLRPLLARQFGEKAVGKAGQDVQVHDAFVVRYDARGGQRHLPLHRDESTHSFTIALNDASEYVGGGTYVAELGRSIKADLGGVVSFRGDLLLHGGDPIVEGVRYIIVAFCYVGEEEEERRRLEVEKKSKKRNISSSTDTTKESILKRPKKVNDGFNWSKQSSTDMNGGEGGFSFGFQF